MHLISAGKLKEAASKYLDAVEIVRNFARKIEFSNWQNLIEIQADYRTAEAVGNFTVFNIKGNNYRLIVSIDYEKEIIYIKYILTHAEYDKEQWKNDSYF